MFQTFPKRLHPCKRYWHSPVWRRLVSLRIWAGNSRFLYCFMNDLVFQLQIFNRIPYPPFKTLKAMISAFFNQLFAASIFLHGKAIIKHFITAVALFSTHIAAVTRISTCWIWRTNRCTSWAVDPIMKRTHSFHWMVLPCCSTSRYRRPTLTSGEST